MASTDLLAPSELVDFVTEIALEAGRITLEYFQDPGLVIERKDDGTPVTAADKAAEVYLRERITSRFPNDAIVGEEGDDVAGTSGRAWILDPIDGTKSFTAGVPLYANLIAVLDDDVPTLGMINLPALDEMVWATKGGGAFHNGQPCQVSDTAELRGAYLMTSGLTYWPDGALARLTAEGMTIRTWADAYGYALVATGRVAAMVDPLANLWDIAPMQVIIEEAGGSFTDLMGNPTIQSGNGVGCNKALSEKLLAVLPDSA